MALLLLWWFDLALLVPLAVPAWLLCCSRLVSHLQCVQTPPQSRCKHRRSLQQAMPAGLDCCGNSCNRQQAVPSANSCCRRLCSR